MLGIVAIFSAVLGFVAFGSGSASAGHTLPSPTGGDCWRAGTPFWCRTSWITTYDVRLRLINQFTDERPGYYDNAVAACNNWHNFSLPPAGQPDIWCNWSAVYNDTLVYLVKANPPLPGAFYALAYNCDGSGFCSSSSGITMNVWYSVVHLNYTKMDAALEATKTMVFANEIGHTLGLYHHSANVLMEPNLAVPWSFGPTTTDYGQLPPCSGAASTYGVRCVFNLTN